MKVRQKSIIEFDAILVIVCLVLGVLSYYNASNGFDTALKNEASGMIVGECPAPD